MKKLLVIIDMINGFIKEGPLSDENINLITPNIIELIKKYKTSNDDIISFQDAHSIDSKEFANFPVHCLKGTNESNLIDELLPYKESMNIIYKNSTSGFVCKEFMNYLEENKNTLEEIIITGCCTDICVINFAIPLKNYFNEYNLNTKIIVPKNCVETYNSEIHNSKEYNEMAFKLMKQAGINIEDKK